MTVAMEGVMADTVESVNQKAVDNHKGKPPKNEHKSRGFLGRVTLFFRQMFAELGKVVTPTKSQLVNYVIVVLVFVLIIMVIVTLLDLAFGSVVKWVFTGQL